MFRFRDGRQGAWVSRVPAPLAAMGLMLLMFLTVGTLAAQESGAVEASPNMPSLDYDGFLKATLAITRDMRDVEQAFRRMVFNVLARNRDDHVRQHAYLMDERGEWRLAPAFDLTFANGPGGEHYMAVEGEGHAITHRHVETLGLRHGIAQKRIAEIVEAVRDALGDWPRHARATGVGASLATVSGGLEQMDRQFQGSKD